MTTEEGGGRGLEALVVGPRVEELFFAAPLTPLPLVLLLFFKVRIRTIHF